MTALAPFILPVVLGLEKNHAELSFARGIEKARKASTTLQSMHLKWHFAIEPLRFVPPISSSSASALPEFDLSRNRHRVFPGIGEEGRIPSRLDSAQEFTGLRYRRCPLAHSIHSRTIHLKAKAGARTSLLVEAEQAQPRGIAVQIAVITQPDLLGEATQGLPRTVEFGGEKNPPLPKRACQVNRRADYGIR
jgi:hypothetical protein